MLASLQVRSLGSMADRDGGVVGSLDRAVHGVFDDRKHLVLIVLAKYCLSKCLLSLDPDKYHLEAVDIVASPEFHPIRQPSDHHAS